MGVQFTTRWKASGLAVIPHIHEPSSCIDVILYGAKFKFPCTHAQQLANVQTVSAVASSFQAGFHIQVPYRQVSLLSHTLSIISDTGHIRTA